MPLKPPAARSLDPAWFDAMQSRISSRRYNGEAIDDTLLDRLDQTCQRLSHAEAPARAVLVRQAPPEVFTGIVGSYGRVEGAPSLVAFVGTDDAAHDVGYVGEAVILEATALALDTCWIAASFRSRARRPGWPSSARVSACTPSPLSDTPPPRPASRSG